MNSLIFFFKRLRSVGKFSHGLLVFFVALLFFCAMSTLPPWALADESVRLSAVRKAIAIGSPSDLQQLLDKIPDEMVAELVPEWVGLLDRKPLGLDWTVLKTLERGQFGALEKSGPLLDRLRKYLDHNEAATRAIAVDVLVKLGPHALPAMTDGLRDRSPRVRAGSVAVLNRLKVLSESDAVSASQDLDARVRFASLQALIQSHGPGPTETSMERLLELVADQEIAVAWRAAEMIGKHANRLDTNRLLPVLVPALSRPSVSVAATEALARMGSDAQPAIPKLLEAYPAGSARGAFNRDFVEWALPRIGKPRTEDIPKLIAMLDGEIVGSEDCERRIQVLNVLCRAGAMASAAADLLERISVRDAALSAEQDKRWEVFKKTSRRGDFMHTRFGLSAQLALASLWATTQDVERFVKVAGECSSIEPWTLSFVLNDLPMPEQIVLTKQFLKSQNVHLINCALSTINHTTKPGSTAMIELRPILRSLLFSDQAQPETRFEAYLNTVTADSVDEQEMLRWLDDSQLKLASFAKTAKRLGLRQAETLSRLRLGLSSKDWTIATSCVDAYLTLVTETEKEAARIWQLKMCDSRNLLDWLVEHKSSNPVLLPLASKELKSSDFWIRIRAIECLGNIGPAASKFLPDIQKILEKESEKENACESPSCQACIDAICQITGDPQRMDDLVNQLKRPREQGGEAYGDYHLMALLKRSPRLVNQNADLILERLKRCTDPESKSIDSDDVSRERDWMKLAKSTGTPRAIECLEALARSKDCLLAKAAKEVLDE